MTDANFELNNGFERLINLDQLADKLTEVIERLYPANTPIPQTLKLSEKNALSRNLFLYAVLDSIDISALTKDAVSSEETETLKEGVKNIFRKIFDLELARPTFTFDPTKSENYGQQSKQATEEARKTNSTNIDTILKELRNPDYLSELKLTVETPQFLGMLSTRLNLAFFAANVVLKGIESFRSIGEEDVTTFNSSEVFKWIESHKSAKVSGLSTLVQERGLLLSGSGTSLENIFPTFFSGQLKKFKLVDIE